MLLQFKFTIGRNEVIKGWEEGILGMQAGGERLLIVPPKLGYGSRKMDGIPANSTLRFGMLLLNISAKIIITSSFFLQRSNCFQSTSF